ncbi:Pirin [uncultured Leptolyngbya sp.]|nr:Pirin [uncultured Leptolyngbya sp.]
MIYLDVQLLAGSHLNLPPEYSEQAVYSVTNGLEIDGEPLEPQRLTILVPGQTASIGARANARCIVVGSEPVGERHKWWNFVSSRLDRIEQAKADWQNGKFGQVPHETELIPLPEQPHSLPEQPL